MTHVIPCQESGASQEPRSLNPGMSDQLEIANLQGKYGIAIAGVTTFSIDIGFRC